jgi:hypothetical protein
MHKLQDAQWSGAIELPPPNDSSAVSIALIAVIAELRGGLAAFSPRS